jgi:DNA mismatch endonuclease (patch repair protein)
MADMFSAKKRSEIMSRIRSEDTQAEKIAFHFLRKNGMYFQKHYKRVLGKPDLALPRKKKAVFIDGDFWHGRDYERIVKSRPDNDYWPIKIANNIARDKRNREELRKNGWTLLVVWESDIKRKSTRDAGLRAIKDFLM